MGDCWQYQGSSLLGLGTKRPSASLYLVPPCFPRFGSKVAFVSEFISPFCNIFNIQDRYTNRVLSVLQRYIFGIRLIVELLVIESNDKSDR